MELNNELPGEVLVTSREVDVSSYNSEQLVVDMLRSPDLVIEVGDPVSPTVGAASAVRLEVLYGSEIGNLKLQSVLMMQLTESEEGVLAETWLEGVSEYGTGREAMEAKTDLLVSLGELLRVLEGEEGQLGESAKRELETLRRLMSPGA